MVKTGDPVRMLRKVLLRRAENASSPEGRLMVAVIVRAYEDLTSGMESLAKDADRFFWGAGLEAYAGAAGIAPNYVRDLLGDLANGHAGRVLR